MIEILTNSELETGSYVEHKFFIQETMASIYTFLKAKKLILEKLFKD